MRLGLAEFDSPRQPAYFAPLSLSDNAVSSKLNQRTLHFICLVDGVCLMFVCPTMRAACIARDGRLGWGRGQKSLGPIGAEGVRKVCGILKGMTVNRVDTWPLRDLHLFCRGYRTCSAGFERADVLHERISESGP